MLILCQKKDTIVNLEKVQAINIHLQNRKEVCAWFDVNENNRNSVLLGVYDTEERAKEVLQEIIKLYKATETFKVTSNRISDEVGAIAIQHGFIYEMPEK